ncbi:sigma-54 interaction domain-containing protein [Pedobacter jamesrossensis]|uniref:Sigma-54 interaction domain-containing protein n=1 Tax=Pedobacter jamesrossensis TaxID=1908238 RepID=A0ABV8NM43_9SPHI
MEKGITFPTSLLKLNGEMANFKSDEECEPLTQLFSLSEKISAARSIIELVKNVEEPFKKLFSVNKFAFVLRDKSSKCHIFLSGDVKCGDAFPQHRILSDSFLDRTVRLGEFDIYGPGEISKNIDSAAQNSRWYSAAADNFFGFSLSKGTDVLGVLLMEGQSTRTVQETDFSFAQSISSQLSLAISNIYALNEIRRQDRERQLLLDLNAHIATVRDTNELLGIINDHLKNTIGFSHTLIGTVNEDGLTTSAFLLDPNSAPKNHPMYADAKCVRYAINDGFMNICADQSDPVLFDLDELIIDESTPLYIKLNYESGIRHLAMSRFRKNNNVFGFWMLFFPEGHCPSKACLSLISGISSQISIAVSNVKANEEIERREKEKSTLLKFSNDLASSTKKDVLERVVKQQLSALFSIENFSLHAVRENKKEHELVLSDPDADFSQYDILEDFSNGLILTSDSIFSRAINLEEPDFITLGRPNNPGSASLSELFKTPLSLLVIPIKIESEVIGILSFTSDRKDPEFLDGNLFRSVCSQIAISLANLEAREATKLHIKEISRSNVQLEDEKTYLQQEIDTFQNSSEVIGSSTEMSQVFKLVSQVASSVSTVLLLGETGTGKELIARAIHNASPRRDQLMVKVNCAALPANLIESELFGHERGSFTGATERRIGKFELANNGTLFLDEIGEMPLDLQVKLLRALQEREIERIGGKGTIKVNVRVIAATNRDLEKEMEAGNFRSDLFYRLNIFPISLPALRDRKSDIPELANFFMLRFAKRSGKKISDISKKAMQELTEYSWPGNIRELEHQLERTVLLTNDHIIREFHLPCKKQLKNFENVTNGFDMSTLEENERKHILSILMHCNGRIAGVNGAASVLGIPSSTLSSRMRKLGIKRQHQV